MNRVALLRGIPQRMPESTHCHPAAAPAGSRSASQRQTHSIKTASLDLTDTNPSGKARERLARRSNRFGGCAALAISAGLLLTGTGCTLVQSRQSLEIERWEMARTPVDRTAARLGNDTAENLFWAKSFYDRLMAVEGPRTIENTLVPYNHMNMHLEASLSECSLLYNVHPAEAVRKMAEKGEQQVAQRVTELSLDRDLYEAIKSVDIADADAKTKYYVKKILQDFRRAGVDLGDDERARIAALNEEILALGQTFARNIAADVREITVESPADLAGLPQDWIDGHPPAADGKIHITTQYPDSVPFLNYAHNGDARRRLFLAYRNRGYPANINVLDQLIASRHELANLLGYSTYADYITEDKMIGSAEATQKFIDRLARAGEEAARREKQMLLERKRQDDSGAEHIDAWEGSYYQNMVKAETYAFDAQSVRPYFNFEDVQDGIFTLTGKLFGIRYEPVNGLDLWHEDVTAWDVYEGNRILGRFYLDLHPRDNKYGHAAQFDYRGGVKGLRLPQAVLVCNFPDPKNSKNGVALMDHSQVVTFFHEFGHLLHSIFAGHQPWLGISGISTEWDFVEAPSQILEEWCYASKPLQVFARHHETGEPIPEELVKKLKRAANFGKGLQNARQLFLSAVSLTYYNRNPDSLDTTDTLKELAEKYYPYRHADGTHLQCNFGHLDGYSAIYYTYRWSLVIAKAMLSRFEAEGLMNTRTASDYRKAVLDPGGSKPAADLVKDFLGKPYSFTPFEKWLNKS